MSYDAGKDAAEQTLAAGEANGFPDLIRGIAETYGLNSFEAEVLEQAIAAYQTETASTQVFFRD